MTARGYPLTVPLFTAHPLTPSLLARPPLLFPFLTAPRRPSSMHGDYIHPFINTRASVDPPAVPPPSAIMAECGDAQSRLAGERLDYERALEQTVLENSVLQQLLDNDIPNVTKLRKTLAKLTLDMDASRSRWASRDPTEFGCGAVYGWRGT